MGGWFFVATTVRWNSPTWTTYVFKGPRQKEHIFLSVGNTINLCTIYQRTVLEYQLFHKLNQELIGSICSNGF
jgi:hypothetical protein